MQTNRDSWRLRDWEMGYGIWIRDYVLGIRIKGYETCVSEVLVCSSS